MSVTNAGSRRRSRWIAAAAVAALAVAVLLGGVFRDPPETADRPQSGDIAAVSPFELLAVAVDEDFPQPPARWAFEFPADHGAHADYRTEWWSLSGTLSGARGSDLPRVGVQWLLMRVALRAEREQPPVDAPAEPESAWRTTQVYAGLLSISAPAGAGLRADGKLSRGAVGLAGATTEPVRIWIEDWQLIELEAGSAAPGFALRVGADGIELDLELRGAKPRVTAGDLGGAGGASAAPFQFYTEPRLRARGTLLADGRQTEVDGLFSLEHAWGELPLPGGPVGNDRFTLHLDDGSEVILLRTHRTRGGGEESASATGLVIDPSGAASALAGDDVQLEPLEHWTSPRTRARYPIRWRLRIPDRSLDVTLTPPSPDQEGETWLPFWAGPVEVDGTAAGAGFVQLSGYAER